MNPETVMTVGSRALEITLMLAAPLLLVALVTGLVVGEGPTGADGAPGAVTRQGIGPPLGVGRPPAGYGLP